MEWTRSFGSHPRKPRAARAPPATRKAMGVSPGGSRDSCRAAKNSFALKYKKSTKISLETFSIFLKHPGKTKQNKQLKRELSVRVSSPEMQPMAHSQSWGGLRARRGCRRRFYGNNRLYGEGGWGRRQKAPQGWGRMLCTSAPGCCPGGPSASLLSVQIKALSTTQGSYADCAQCKADCRDNWLGSHAAQPQGTA